MAFAEIGGALRLTEEAARKRVERALDRLAEVLKKRGIASTGAALGVTLGGQVGATVPVGLLTEVSRASLAAKPVAVLSIANVGCAAAVALVLAGVALLLAQRESNAAHRLCAGGNCEG